MATPHVVVAPEQLFSRDELPTIPHATSSGRGVKSWLVRMMMERQDAYTEARDALNEAHAALRAKLQLVERGP